MKFVSLVLLTIALLGCSDPFTKGLVESQETNDLIITNVNIFNGRDSLLLLHKDVIIEGGRIERIQSSSDEAPQGYQIIEGTNYTLMPGLIDAHVHLSSSAAVPWGMVQANMEYNLSAYLYAGITTVYDLGGLAPQLESLAREVENGDIIGPSIYHTHIPITVKNAHPIPLTKEMMPWPLKSLVNVLSPLLEEVEDIPKEIAGYVDRELDYVKIICDQIPPGSPEITFEQLETAITAAHQLGYKVFVHVGSPENAVMAIKAGADVLAHGIWRGKLQPNDADFIVNSGVPIIYTLAAFHNVHLMNKGEYTPSSFDTTLTPQEVLNPVTGSNSQQVREQKVMNAFFKDVSNKRHFLRSNFEMLISRGATIITGTDSPLPGTYAGSTYHQELAALRKFGLSNYQVLKGATYHPSRLFLDAPEFGYVEEGMQADLLLVEGNPLEDLTVLRNPKLILKGGTIIDRLIEIE